MDTREASSWVKCCLPSVAASSEELLCCLFVCLNSSSSRPSSGDTADADVGRANRVEKFYHDWGFFQLGKHYNYMSSRKKVPHIKWQKMNHVGKLIKKIAWRRESCV